MNVAAVGFLALLTWAIFEQAYLGSDQLHALIWGGDLAEGRIPNYDTPFAPTPHPLTVLVSGLASLAGEDGGYHLLVALAYVSFGGLVWAVFRVGSAAFDGRIGLLAALLFGTSFPVLARALSGYLDIPFVALVLTAALMEIRHPRRGAPVLVVLAIAGLLRPEAWVIAGIYWLYLAPPLNWRRRVNLMALALAAPVLWAAWDLLLTGDAVHSFRGAREVASSTGLDTVAAGNLASEAFEDFRSIMRLPVIVAGAAGVVAALAAAPTRARVPAALLAMGLGTIIGLLALDLPTADRFLFLPGTALAIFCAFAALGWIGRPPGLLRRTWAVTGVLILAVLALTAPAHVSRLQRLDTDIADRVRAERDLRALTRTGSAAQALRRCKPVTIATHHPTALLAYRLDRSLATVRAGELGRPRQGAFIAPTSQRVAELTLSASSESVPRIVVPAGFTQLTRNRSWAVYTRGC